MNYKELCGNNKAALQFSGGKDSLVLLHMMQPYWDNLTVYYCNSGDSFPETQELVDAIKSIVPHFIEVEGKKKQTEAIYGWPSDVVICNQATEKQLVVDRFTCCYHSIMAPLHERMKQDGIQVILRGQRNDDAVKGPIKNGEMVDGFQIVYPLNDFSEEDVFSYLNRHAIPIPRYYTEGMRSAPDCMHCTAWLEHKQAKYVDKFYPTTAKVVFYRLNEIQKMVSEKYNELLTTIEG